MPFLPYPATGIQAYALVFLLGSYSVAALSDLRRMAAQSDFAEVWVAVSGFLFSVDVYLLLSGALPVESFIIKWVAILALSMVALLMRSASIAPMDVAAAAATAAALPPASAALYFVFIAVVGELLSPVLRRFGSDGAYPFLPAVFVSSAIVVCGAFMGALP